MVAFLRPIRAIPGLMYRATENPVALARRAGVPQDRQRWRARGPVYSAAHPGQPGSSSGPAPTRPNVSALHAPEVECIGKGKVRAPYEFGDKVSVITLVTPSKGGTSALALFPSLIAGHAATSTRRL